MERRQFLRTASLGAGSALLSPVLRQVQAQAAGDKPPVRFVFVLESNGRHPEYMQPSGIEWPEGGYHTRVPKLIDQPLTRKNKLPTGLAPLQPYIDRMTVIQGLSGKICNGGGHSANFGALGCSPGSSPHGKAFNATIDAELSRHLPAVFPMAVMGIVNDQKPSMVYNCSAWGKDRPAATICHPDLAYSSIFGSVADGAARRQFVAKRNLLDFMVDDIKRIDWKLAGSERDKFQRHIGAFEELRHRESRLNEVEGTLRKHAPVFDDKFQSPVESDRLDAHFDLAAAALIGGLTNVVTLASGTGQMFMSVKFTGLGLTIGKHEYGHNTPDKVKGMTAEQSLDLIRSYHAGLIVRLIKKLEAVPEGGGTMMDNTLIFFASCAGNTHHPGYDQWPLLMVGNLGGRLKAGGRFLGYPKYGGDGHRTMANLYLSFLHAVGDRRETFGVQDHNLRDLDQTGPLTELMA